MARAGLGGHSEDAGASGSAAQGLQQKLMAKIADPDVMEQAQGLLKNGALKKMFGS